MDISICKDNNTYIWGFHVPFNAWYGQDGDDSWNWWVCTVHGQPKEDNTLELRRFNGENWVKVRENSDTTQAICQWATSLRLWWTKCHWFKDEDKEKNLVTRQLIKHERHTNSLKNMMRHDRRHKKGGSGIRLDVENFRADKTFTEYSEHEYKYSGYSSSNCSLDYFKRPAYTI